MTKIQFHEEKQEMRYRKHTYTPTLLENSAITKELTNILLYSSMNLTNSLKPSRLRISRFPTPDHILT